MVDKSLVVDLAASILDFAGKSARPPQAAWKEGEDILVLCADGRKVRFSPLDVERVMTYAHLPIIQPVLSVEVAKGRLSPKASSRRGKK